ncbi:MAG TPA: PepSY domain-containing protein [Chthoniobacterales bacterium]|nr:PepSY domain-containing protein [Chthoniobacterales bacterium]
MNQSARSLLCVVLAGSLSTSALGQMSDREFKRLDEGKITKNQAQHFVLAKYPRAEIKKCELRSNKGASVWDVELVKAGEKKVTKVEVDGRTGKVVP